MFVCYETTTRTTGQFRIRLLASGPELQCEAIVRVRYPRRFDRARDIVEGRDGVGPRSLRANEGSMSMITTKVWGTTEALIDTPLLAVHRLKIHPWARCSTHCHQHKWNAFYVRSGLLEIEMDGVARFLRPGQFITVRPGAYHLFRTAFMPCEAIEFYYPEGLSEDIIRKDQGERCFPTKQQKDINSWIDSLVQRLKPRWLRRHADSIAP